VHRTLPLLAVLLLASQANAEGGVFVGSTPCGGVVREFLDLPAANCEVVRWKLFLGLDAKNVAPGPGEASVEYGLDGKRLKKVVYPLTWAVGTGMLERPGAKLFELKRDKRVLRFWKVTDEVVHLLDAERRLLAGNGGFGYALSIALAQQPEPRPAAIAEFSYKLLPLASGPEVYGVFEGRTPCEIARAINLPVSNCLKLKWRVTLFQDPKTQALSRYRLEGALFPRGAREGEITLLDGTPFDPGAQVIRLELPEPERSNYVWGRSAEPLHLMRGDENVLFFLDRTGKLIIGNRDFGYVLSRRAAASS
jgi:hypothetical protein